jgi:hypothetical protein
MNNKVMKEKLAKIDKSLAWARSVTQCNLSFLIDDLEKARFNIVTKIGKKSNGQSKI